VEENKQIEQKRQFKLTRSYRLQHLLRELFFAAIAFALRACLFCVAPSLAVLEFFLRHHLGCAACLVALPCSSLMRMVSLLPCRL